MADNVPMHDTYTRLLQAAMALRGWDGPGVVATKLTERGYTVSPQTIANWKNRGVPAEAILAIAPLIGCSERWLHSEDGDMDGRKHTTISQTQEFSRAHYGAEIPVCTLEADELRLLEAYRLLDPIDRDDLVVQLLDRAERARRYMVKARRDDSA